MPEPLSDLIETLAAVDRFAMPAVFGLLPLAIAVCVRMLRPGYHPAMVWPTLERDRRAGTAAGLGLNLVPLLRLLALAALIVALARPQSVERDVWSSTDAVALQLCVDRSSSMNEPVTLDGAQITRLDAVKRVAREFVFGRPDSDRGLQGREGDLIGITTFAGFAETVCPPVREHEAVLALLDRIETADRRLRDDGTAVGDGLRSAVARLNRLESAINDEVGGGFSLRSKAVILMTDGQSNQGIAPEEAVRDAVESGVRVYTIGIGASSDDGSIFARLRRNAVDDRLLREIAQATGARFWLAETAESLRDIYAEIDGLERSEIRSETDTRYEELYHPWAILGLVLLGIETLLRTVILRRLP